MIRFVLIILMCVMAQPSLADEKLDYQYFEQLPILDHGRLKPIGTFAKTRMKDFYGSHKDENAWLAEVIFNPSQAVEGKIFTIKNNDLKMRLDLAADEDSFNLQDLEQGLTTTQKDVASLLQQESDDLTAEQNALLKIHEDALSYNELLRSFSFLLPLENDQTFQDLLPQEQRILASLKATMNDKGQDITGFSEEEQKKAMLGFQLQQIRSGGQGNDDLKVLPVRLNGVLEWVAPWQILNEGKGSPKTSELLALWGNAAKAYRDNNAAQWIKATRELHDKNTAIAGNSLNPYRLKAELLYQAIRPYHLAMIFYAVSILLFIIQKNRVALVTLITAIFSHTIAIAARVYILDRPPVGTLYESVLFVSLVCSILSILFYIQNRKTIIPVTGQSAALGLLAIAPTMLSGHDSLELLVAVLNTNFWLATHVLCITAGYGVCILAACLSHAYMVVRIKNAAHPSLEGLLQYIHKISILALLLTSIGTVLGGIWADQSWGRFWGWDPKENGALLIVLWLIWVQHGRLSGHIRPLAFVAGMAALNIIVAIAWFGVNLLGVGLHSYGFTSGIATGLAVFCVLETVLIVSLWLWARKNGKRLHT